jgi:CDP-diacylglycerol---serine O-phosphatidyltransferase
MRHLPNIVTLGNLFFGCMAIMFILMDAPFSIPFGDDQYWAIGTANFYYGAWCIIIAAGFDWIDGFVARALKVESELGAMLDSLSDIVSFGVAPSMIIMKLLWMATMSGENALSVPAWAVAPAFLIACFGALRLAIFNLAPKNNDQFTGIPIPAVGLTIAGIGLMYYHNSLGWNEFLQNKWLLYALIILFSYGMVSKLKLFSMKPNGFGIKENWGRYLLIALTLLSSYFLNYAAIPFALVAYIIISIFYKPIAKQKLNYD